MCIVIVQDSNQNSKEGRVKQFSYAVAGMC